MGLTERVKNRAKHPTGGAVTGRLAAHDPRNNTRVNSVADRMGHGKGVKGTSIEDARNHHSAPLTTLKDPAAFGPPPKHVNYHGEAAAQATGSPIRSGPPALPSSKPTLPSSRPTPYVPSDKPAPRPITSNGLGGALPKTMIEKQTKTEEERQAEEAANKPPPVPYRLDTTGLNTTGLPKPPVRRVESPEADAPVRSFSARTTTKPKPQPPPRLPARQNSNPTEFTPPPPPTYAAATEPESEPKPQTVQPAAPTSMSQLSELQSRFGRLPGRVSSPPAQPPRPTESPTATSLTPPEPPAGGTTWAQKQAALRTASQFNKDPSSVSTTDAVAAANTARDFHQRHGEQVASGWQKAKGLDSKYGVRGKVGSLVQGQEQGVTSNAAGAASTEQVPSQPQSTPSPGVAAAVAAKKAPPPAPPPKRNGLHGHAIGSASAEGANGGAPPPVPLSSKPT